MSESIKSSEQMKKESPSHRGAASFFSRFIPHASSFRPRPVARWESFLLRLFFAILAVSGMWKVLPFEKVEMANGIASFVDLSFLGGADAMVWFRPLVVVAAVLYVLHWLNPLGITLLTLAHLGYHTLHNSQGFTYHGNNIVGLVLLAQWATELFWFGYKLVKKKSFAFPDGLTNAAYQLYFSQCAVAAVYVTSAITKLSKSDGLWLFRSHYLAKSIVKTHRQTHYDNPSLGTLEPVIPVAQWLADHHLVTRLAFGAGFMLELFAFLALWNRAWALFIGLSIIAFHFGVEAIMQLDFRVNQIMCLIFLVNVPFWMVWLVGQRKKLGV
jgi:hypothetical protein